MLLKLIPVTGHRVVTIKNTFKGNKIFLIDYLNEIEGNKLPNIFPVIDPVFMTLRGKANDTSSHLDSSLKNLITTYLNLNRNMIIDLKLEGFNVSDHFQTIERKVNKIDFMKRRGILSEILKKDKRLGGKNANTKLFHDFILERNKYAHGVFCLLIHDYIPMLHYELGGNLEYAPVTEEIIKSFIDTYLFLDNWLSELANKIQQLNKEGKSLT